MREVLFDHQSNRGVWVETFVFRDGHDGDGIRLTLADGTPRFEITASLLADGPHAVGWYPWSVSPFYDYPVCDGVRLQATLASGISIVDDGVIVARMDLRSLFPGRWRFALILDDGETPFEAIRGILPVVPY